MFLIVVLFVLVSLAAADPLGCCMPFRYSGWLHEVGGSIKRNQSGSLIDNNIELHYDYNKQMIVVVSHEYNFDTDVRRNTTSVYDYKNGMMHIIYDHNKCHTEHLDPHTMYHPCLIQTFQYGGSYTVGSDRNRFQVNTFDGMLGKYTFSMAVTTDHCLPVADKMYGDDGNSKVIVAFLFSNIDTNGVNDALFSVPSYCDPSIISTVIGKRDLEMLNLQRRPLSYPV